MENQFSEPTEILAKKIELPDEEIAKICKNTKELLSEVANATIFKSVNLKEFTLPTKPLSPEYLIKGSNKDTYEQSLANRLSILESKKEYISFKNFFREILSVHNAIDKNDKVRLNSCIFAGDNSIYPVEINKFINSIILDYMFGDDAIFDKLLRTIIVNDSISLNIFQFISGLYLNVNTIACNNIMKICSLISLKDTDPAAYEILSNLNKEVVVHKLGSLEELLIVQISRKMPCFFPNFDSSNNPEDADRYLEKFPDKIATQIYQPLSICLDTPVIPLYQVEVCEAFSGLNFYLSYPIIKVVKKSFSILTPVVFDENSAKRFNKFMYPFPFLPLPERIESSIEYWIESKLDHNEISKCKNLRQAISPITGVFKTKENISNFIEICKKYKVYRNGDDEMLEIFLNEMGGPAIHSNFAKFDFESSIFESVQKLVGIVLYEIYREIIEDHKSRGKWVKIEKQYKIPQKTYEKLFFGIKSEFSKHALNNMGTLLFESSSAIEFKKREIYPISRFKEIEHKIIHHTEGITGKQVNSLAIIGKENIGKEFIYLELDNGNIYLISTNEDGQFLILPYCRRDGKPIEPHTIDYFSISQFKKF